MLEGQLLAEVQEVMSIEWRSTVTASDENMRSSFGVTARALVVLTNSTSNHRECLHKTTRRYSPVLIGPQKSMATSFQGSLDNGDICSGSRSFAGVTTGHGWQC